MMNVTLFQQKEWFPSLVLDKLNSTLVDFQEKHNQIERSNQDGIRHLKAGVVVLLHYQNHCGYAFQLIKRSANVAQAGDISCPGGMLEISTDHMLEHILLKTDMVRFVNDKSLRRFPGTDEQTAFLIRLFLMNALREAWEEIGLSPLNVGFLGALPSYSLTLFSRTIFPVVALVKEPYTPCLSDEVEKMLDIPISSFFEPSNYAMLEVCVDPKNSDSSASWHTPCLVLPDGNGTDDVLWGATFNILTNFLKIIASDAFSVPSPRRSVQKILNRNYAGRPR
ncbi:MAG: CoA pyrophosphatase [Syntrophaceae bacterium]|jgi:8-oxo-dGTP pyrophosphatase MutT (NUDIX family)|nr:CoA pyrophosphatase [Syntrophaceae bacterium]